MAQVHIVTDSTADLPEALVRRHGIRVVPLNIHFDDEALQDGIDIWASEFYYRLENTGVLPHTSQPAPGDFLSVFRSLTADGGEVVTLTVSSQVSGTFQSAQIAAEMLGNGAVTVVDTGSASMGLGLIVLAAARVAAAGGNRAEVVAAAEKAARSVKLFFVVDTLEFLQKNGRIGRASALVGSLLNIKPILTMQDGLVTPVEKVRGKVKALSRIFDLLHAELGDGPVRMAVVHADREEEAAQLADRVRHEFNCVEPPLVSEIGPVVGVHAGPGTLAVIGIAAE